VDSRGSDQSIVDPRKIVDTVADNGAAAGIVVGGRPVGPMDVDLRWVGGIMYRNSEIEETGLAAGVLGHPALGVAWLANKLGTVGTALGAEVLGHHQERIRCGRRPSEAPTAR